MPLFWYSVRRVGWNSNNAMKEEGMLSEEVRKELSTQNSKCRASPGSVNSLLIQLRNLPPHNMVHFFSFLGRYFLDSSRIGPSPVFILVPLP
jgi:hypothetical protein